MKAISFLVPLILLLHLRPSSAVSLDVTAFGAKPDGLTDATAAFTAAWTRACASTGNSLIHVPEGRYLIRSAVVFSGDDCKSHAINFKILGTLLAPADYRVLANENSWLSFNNVAGVSISGGTLDGRGAGLWACKAAGHGGCPSGVTSLAFSNSKNISIKGLRLLNSQVFHMTLNGCKNVLIQAIKIISPGNSPNTDGIHIQLSSDVTILKSKFSTGDDCVSIGPGTCNLMVEGATCGPGHGISIGSLGREMNEAGVQNVTIKGSTFVGTGYGVRIKSWGRPSNGFVNNVFYQHLTMVNVRNPIIIDQNYCPSDSPCPKQVSGVKINGVTYEGIRGTSATPVAIDFACSSKNPCKGIRLEDIELTYNQGDKQTLSSCENADGSTSGVVVPKSCL